MQDTCASALSLKAELGCATIGYLVYKNPDTDTNVHTVHARNSESARRGINLIPGAEIDKAASLYTIYPIVARAWPSGCSALRPSASREQMYLAYKLPVS